MYRRKTVVVDIRTIDLFDQDEVRGHGERRKTGKNDSDMMVYLKKRQGERKKDFWILLVPSSGLTHCCRESSLPWDEQI